ncbi:MAG: hypothetical protein ABIC95_00145 [archaeon]
MKKAYLARNFGLVQKVTMAQHVKDTIEYVREYAQKKAVKQVEIELFYLSSHKDGRVIDDLFITDQNAQAGSTFTYADTFLDAMEELERINTVREKNGEDPLYLKGHHHLHPGGSIENEPAAAPRPSHDDWKLYHLLLAKVIASSGQEKRLRVDRLFEGDRMIRKVGDELYFRGNGEYDPAIILPSKALKLRYRKNALQNLALEVPYKFANAFFTIQHINGGPVFKGEGMIVRDLAFGTQESPVIDIDDEIDVVPSHQVDYDALESELEKKIKIKKPEPEKAAVPSHSLEQLTALNRINMLTHFGDASEMTAAELISELGYFFNYIGEKNLNSHPALGVLHELFQGLSHVKAGSGYQLQLGVTRDFLGTLCKAYEQHIIELKKLNNGTG